MMTQQTQYRSLELLLSRSGQVKVILSDRSAR